MVSQVGVSLNEYMGPPNAEGDGDDERMAVVPWLAETDDAFRPLFMRNAKDKDARSLVIRGDPDELYLSLMGKNREIKKLKKVR